MRERTACRRCAIVEVHTDRPVRGGIAHTILITVVNPRRDGHAPSGRSTSSLGSRKSKPCEYVSKAVQSVSAAASNPLTLGMGVVPDVGVVVAAAPPDDLAQPVIISSCGNAYLCRCNSPRISFVRTLTRRSPCAGATFSTSSNGDSVIDGGDGTRR